MTEVLLVNPPARGHSGDAVQPVGLRCLERYLRSEDVDALLVDLREADGSEVDATLRRESPAVVGASVYTHTRAAAHELCRRVRRVAPDAALVLGGHHATLLTRQVLEVMRPDAVVRGEGEAPLLGIVRAVRNGWPLEGLPGVTVMRDGEPIEGPPAAPIPADELPLDGPLHEDRRLTRREARSMAGNALGPRPWEHRSFWTTTTRGDPNASADDGSPLPSPWRKESPRRVVDRLQILHDGHGCRFVTFGDSAFNAEPERVIRICDEIVRRRLEIRWSVSDMRANTTLLPERMLAAMAHAGCALVRFDVQSASTAALRAVGHELGAEDVDRAVRLARRHGIRARVSLVVGHPGESDATIEDTLNFVDTVKPELTELDVARVVPGTALYDEAKARGLVDDSYWIDGAAPVPLFAEATYARTMRWRSLLGFRRVPGRRALARLMEARGWLRQRHGIDIGRRGVRWAAAPPLFTDGRRSDAPKSEAPRSLLTPSG